MIDRARSFAGGPGLPGAPTIAEQASLRVGRVRDNPGQTRYRIARSIEPSAAFRPSRSSGVPVPGTPESSGIAMCNLYSLRTGPADLRRAFDIVADHTGNLPPLPAIFPDQLAPVVLNGTAGRSLAMMRWGMPGPKAFGEHPITNVRNVASPHWRPWLGVAHRCLVPVTAFSEYADTKPRKTPVWFALDEDRPLFAFAGIWRPWTGVRGTKRENPDRAAEEHRLFAFLTTEPNGVVGPVHPKAMPVLLTRPEEWATWLEAPTAEALRLQRPLPDGDMREVARGARSDGAESGT